MIEKVKEALIQLVSLTLIDLSSSQPHGMVKEIEDKAQQICQLFEPKPDEELEIVKEALQTVNNEKFELMCQLEGVRAECQARVERIFKEIEEKFLVKLYFAYKADFTHSTWETFKEKGLK